MRVGHHLVSTHLLWGSFLCCRVPGSHLLLERLAVRPDVEEDEAAPERVLETKHNLAQRREGPESWEWMLFRLQRALRPRNGDPALRLRGVSDQEKQVAQPVWLGG